MAAVWAACVGHRTKTRWQRGPAPDRGAETENKGYNRANEPPQFKKANSLPPDKQNNREQGRNKTWEKLFLFKTRQCCWDAGADSVSRLGRLCLYNALVKKHWWTAGSIWSLQNGSDPWWWVVVGPPPLANTGSSSGSIAELSRAQREQERECHMSVPCFKEDSASLPCRKPG